MIRSLKSALKVIKHQDEILGRLTREVEQLRDTESRRQDWLCKAKKEAGFHDTRISFDEVWKIILAKALKRK
jgi:hypothetical protein